jgi:hypothetical protein
MTTYICILLMVAVAGSCGGQPSEEKKQLPDTTGISGAVKKSREVSKELLGTVKGVLMKQLAVGGPVHAISACADTAQSLSDQIAEEYGLSIRRVSHKWRNPKDTPDAYETEVLQHFAFLTEEDELDNNVEHYEITTVDSIRYFRYMKPIVVQPVCLPCHGDRAAMKDLITTVLLQRYPEDKAVGYKADDLRGAVSVKMRLD